MALTVCADPSCPDLARGTYCAKHQSQRRKASDAKRPNARQRGYDSRWQRTRAEFLRAFPFCSEPGCFEPATEVDHIDGLGPLGPLGHDWSNLRSFCKSHHSKRTARDQPGGLNR